MLVSNQSFEQLITRKLKHVGAWMIRIWTPFTAERCSTLAGKLKLFFNQACQGDQLDSGMKLKKVNQSRTETDSASLSYRILTHADILIAYPTMAVDSILGGTQPPDHALCLELNKSVNRLDLLSILTRVGGRVAVDFQSNTPADWVMHENKQIPCIMSMLTRDVRRRSSSLTTASSGKGTLTYLTCSVVLSILVILILAALFCSSLIWTPATATLTDRHLLL